MYEQGCTCHSLSIAYTCHIQQTHAHAHATCTCARRCTRAHQLYLHYPLALHRATALPIPCLSQVYPLLPPSKLDSSAQRASYSPRTAGRRRSRRHLRPGVWSPDSLRRWGATSLELSSPTIAPFRIRRLLGAPARCAVVLLTLRLGHEHGQRPAVGGYLPYTYPPLTHLLTRPPVMGAARVPCMHTDSYLVQKRTPCVSLTSIR
jgi:hypothetical protein